MGYSMVKLAEMNLFTCHFMMTFSSGYMTDASLVTFLKQCIYQPLFKMCPGIILIFSEVIRLQFEE